mgnify:CR=1 FL=1
MMNSDEEFGFENVLDDGNVGTALRTHFASFVALQRIMSKNIDQWRNCGSYLIYPGNLSYDPSMYHKQRLLYEKTSALPDDSLAVEIGIHGGHSLLLMLMANPTLRITAIDICHWDHTEPCVAELNSRFGDRISLIKGYSHDILPTLDRSRFNLIHIDGDHQFHVLVQDTRLSIPLALPGATYVFDDYDMGVQRVLDEIGGFHVVAIPDCTFRNCVAVRELLPLPRNVLNARNVLNVHLVLYSYGQPFDTTKRLTIDSVYRNTRHNVIVHDYNLERIKRCEWFDKIASLPDVHRDGRRDGYYCAYKAFCPMEVYESMSEGDVLYYVDCSQHFITGFTQSIDKLCDIALRKGFIAGSVGDNVRNDSYKCCDNLDVWNKIIPGEDNRVFLSDRHVLASWFILTKNSFNTLFMKEWVYWCAYKDSDLTDPLITYHHPADQSIFNILVRKYNPPVFYHPQIKHDDNKNKNRVLEVINGATDDIIDSYFITLNA